MERIGVILGGPTGVGKTSLSLSLAKQLKADIISSDSAQVYRGLNIGTAKISKEEMQGVRHWMLDVVEPVEKFSVGSFCEQVNSILKKKYEQNENVLLVGGTGLYLHAVSEGFSSLPSANASLREKFQEKNTQELYAELLEKDTLSANSIHKNNRVRIERALEVFLLTGKSFFTLSKQNKKNNSYSFVKFALEREREHLYERINHRVDLMVEEGLLEEVTKLYAQYGNSLKKLRIIGYSQVIEYLDGLVSFEKAVENIKKESRHYAKRQFTWFKNQGEYYWYNLDRSKEKEILEDMNNFLIKK